MRRKRRNPRGDLKQLAKIAGIGVLGVYGYKAYQKRQAEKLKPKLPPGVTVEWRTVHSTGILQTQTWCLSQGGKWGTDPKGGYICYLPPARALPARSESGTAVRT